MISEILADAIIHIGEQYIDEVTCDFSSLNISLLKSNFNGALSVS